MSDKKQSIPVERQPDETPSGNLKRLVERKVKEIDPKSRDGHIVALKRVIVYK